MDESAGEKLVLVQGVGTAWGRRRCRGLMLGRLCCLGRRRAPLGRSCAHLLQVCIKAGYHAFGTQSNISID